MTSSSDLNSWIVESLDDLKARDVTVLNVTKLTTITDFMVIASGTSARHVSSLVDHLLHDAKQQGIEVLGVEGRSHSDWVLVDLGDALVHVMKRETRVFYDLERLWSTSAESEVRA